MVLRAGGFSSSAVLAAHYRIRPVVSVIFGDLSLNLTHLGHGFFNHRTKDLPALLFQCERVRE